MLPFNVFMSGGKIGAEEQWCLVGAIKAHVKSCSLREGENIKE